MLSVAGYFVIVFGKMFDFGDRIQLGDVRGDVLDIGLFKTTVMEMGVPQLMMPDPHSWVASRQYTGRVVTITNAEIFKQPTYNYTRNFDFLWEEMRLPLRHGTELARAEAIVLAAVREVTAGIIEEGHQELANMRKRYLIHSADMEPRAFLRLTDSWMELSVRFLVKSYGVREAKDLISRRILEQFNAAGIELASATMELALSKVPPLELRGPGARPASREDPAASH